MISSWIFWAHALSLELFLDGVRGFYLQAELTDSHIGYLRGEGLDREGLKMVADIQARYF